MNMQFDTPEQVAPVLTFFVALHTLSTGSFYVCAARLLDAPIASQPTTAQHGIVSSASCQISNSTLVQSTQAKVTENKVQATTAGMCATDRI